MTLEKEQAEMDKLAVVLKKRLRLQDWNTVICVKRHFDMPDSRYGSCNDVVSRKEAVISILWSGDRVPVDGQIPDSAACTLAHELLHLHFAPFWDDAHELAMEQAIQCLATAFVKGGDNK